MFHSTLQALEKDDGHLPGNLPHFQNTPDPQVFSLSWQGVNSEFFWCCLANWRTISTLLTREAKSGFSWVYKCALGRL